MPPREALVVYKALHRTIQRVFKEDIQAMLAARDKVCDEFSKNRGVTNENSIKELIQQGRDVNTILSESVVQVKRKNTEEDMFELKIRPETHMFDNTKFRNDVLPEEYRAANRKARMRGKCDDGTKDKKSPF